MTACSHGQIWCYRTGGPPNARHFPSHSRPALAPPALRAVGDQRFPAPDRDNGLPPAQKPLQELLRTSLSAHQPDVPSGPRSGQSKRRHGRKIPAILRLPKFARASKIIRTDAGPRTAEIRRNSTARVGIPGIGQRFPAFNDSRPGHPPAHPNQCSVLVLSTPHITGVSRLTGEGSRTTQKPRKYGIVMPARRAHPHYVSPGTYQGGPGAVSNHRILPQHMRGKV